MFLGFLNDLAADAVDTAYGRNDPDIVANAYLPIRTFVAQKSLSPEREGRIVR